MKQYDFAGMKKYIQLRSDTIDYVQAGMAEDWFFTAETIYKDANFVNNMDEIKEIAGISESVWATPVMEVHFKNGDIKFVDCFTGESTHGKPNWFELGTLSSVVQERVDNERILKLANK